MDRALAHSEATHHEGFESAPHRVDHDALFARLEGLAPEAGPHNVDTWPGLTVERFCAPANSRRTETDSLSVGFVAQAGRPPAYVIPAGSSDIEIASVRSPVFHCTLPIDPQLVRSTSSSMYPFTIAAGRADPVDGLRASPLDDELLHTVVGFLESLAGTCDRRVLAPLRMREMVYRLLRGEQRARLSRLAADELLRNPIAAVLSHISDHLAEPLSVDALAVRAHMSPSAFSRAFREATGRPPYQYIKDCRLDRARDLLDDRRLGVSGVAVAVGYSSVSHFIKEFHRRHGSTPGEYAEIQLSSTRRQER